MAKPMILVIQQHHHARVIPTHRKIDVIGTVKGLLSLSQIKTHTVVVLRSRSRLQRTLSSSLQRVMDRGMAFGFQIWVVFLRRR